MKNKSIWITGNLKNIEHCEREDEVLCVLTNQKAGFSGVQSNLQSNKNYRNDNMRLEMEFVSKSVEIWAFIALFLFSVYQYWKMKIDPSKVCKEKSYEIDLIFSISSLIIHG